MSQNNKMKKKKSNPLFVVKEGTVEEAKNPFDFLIKKMGLGPVLDFLENMINILYSEVKDYVTLANMNKIFQDIIMKLEEYVQSTLFLLKDFIERNLFKSGLASVPVKSNS